MDAIVREHWATYGRNYYARHDYEAIDAQVAAELMDALRASLPTLPGEAFGALKVEAADDFTYVDPIDGSTSGKQGVRVLFEGGSRIMFRLSGTGTEGATLRVYLERYAPPAEDLHRDVAAALSDLVAAADALAQITERTGRAAPDVIT